MSNAAWIVPVLVVELWPPGCGTNIICQKVHQFVTWCCIVSTKVCGLILSRVVMSSWSESPLPSRSASHLQIIMCTWFLVWCCWSVIGHSWEVCEGVGLVDQNQTVLYQGLGGSSAPSYGFCVLDASFPIPIGVVGNEIPCKKTVCHGAVCR